MHMVYRRLERMPAPSAAPPALRPRPTTIGAWVSRAQTYCTCFHSCAVMPGPGCHAVAQPVSSTSPASHPRRVMISLSVGNVGVIGAPARRPRAVETPHPPLPLNRNRPDAAATLATRHTLLLLFSSFRRGLASAIGGAT